MKQKCEFDKYHDAITEEDAKTLERIRNTKKHSNKLETLAYINDDEEIMEGEFVE